MKSVKNKYQKLKTSCCIHTFYCQTVCSLAHTDSDRQTGQGKQGAYCRSTFPSVKERLPIVLTEIALEIACPA